FFELCADSVSSKPKWLDFVYFSQGYIWQQVDKAFITVACDHMSWWWITLYTQRWFDNTLTTTNNLPQNIQEQLAGTFLTLRADTLHNSILPRRKQIILIHLGNKP